LTYYSIKYANENHKNLLTNKSIIEVTIFIIDNMLDYFDKLPTVDS